MTLSQTRLIALVAGVLFSLSCGAESDAPKVVGLHIKTQRFANSEWSAPVNVGSPVNSSAGE